MKKGELTPGAARILEVASELFYERGIHAVGVDTIAAESGVTKRTLYNRFGSKDGLLMAYLETRDRHWRGLIADRLDELTDPVERVLAPFDVLPRWLPASNRGCSFINAFAELPDADHPGRELVTGEKKWLLALFRDLLAEAGVAGAETRAVQLLALHEGAIVGHTMAEEPTAVSSARVAALTLLRC
ncbi:TetR/AcrR family transcriptional regulator [Pseudonocardia spinosispora]|uniref:TetR/AcrR family transcriptional regulator n=1 Tax=Pseudonocardia spinosispora TaxID=103441 RepID=UPI000427A114|nr:TetR/AcrR family transcriptional regulator [Pseudonocardia spinosispora]